MAKMNLMSQGIALSLSSHETLITQCREDVNCLRVENKTLQDKVCLLEQQMHSNATTLVQEIASESQERITREKNVLIMGLPESSNLEEDKTRINSLIKLTNPSLDLKYLKIMRLGKEKSLNKERPIKLELNTKESAMHLIKTQNLIKQNQHFTSVSIKSDQTKIQLNYLKTLQE
ncbi:unnamed protein product [Ceutorhynchus assimilis]|uniref:Uncharacterized protein n=1 Tax=Ceutorhynchus assimilis TaxID=467358 RepID=A0A9N9MYY6_9CUCU|nr:unnamed protein product [Ceutorhynchus assimilis]